jgi:hypothetical protein
MHNGSARVIRSLRTVGRTAIWCRTVNGPGRRPRRTRIHRSARGERPHLVDMPMSVRLAASVRGAPKLPIPSSSHVQLQPRGPTLIGSSAPSRPRSEAESQPGRSIHRSSNAVELGCRMEQADRRRRVVGNVLLFSSLHQESRMLRAFHRAGAGALPAGRVRPLSDFLNCLPDCLRESQRGKKPPARKPGGG